MIPLKSKVTPSEKSIEVKFSAIEVNLTFTEKRLGYFVIKQICERVEFIDQLKLVGNIAAILCTFNFLPQTIKTIRTRDTKSLSLPTYLVFFIGIALWAYYGYLSQIAAILIGNSITPVFSGIILFFKLIEKPYKND
jgi:MtN3 and saliva related transmembrane protein